MKSPERGGLTSNVSIDFFDYGVFWLNGLFLVESRLSV
jgi:hypothetical protein